MLPKQLTGTVAYCSLNLAICMGLLAEPLAQGDPGVQCRLFPNLLRSITVASVLSKSSAHQGCGLNVPIKAWKKPDGELTVVQSKIGGSIYLDNPDPGS